MILDRILTRNYTRVPLVMVNFNLQDFKRFGAHGSCRIIIHPEIRGDQFVEMRMREIIDHIRSTYNMEKLSKL